MDKDLALEITKPYLKNLYKCLVLSFEVYHTIPARLRLMFDETTKCNIMFNIFFNLLEAFYPDKKYYILEGRSILFKINSKKHNLQLILRFKKLDRNNLASNIETFRVEELSQQTYLFGNENFCTINLGYIPDLDYKGAQLKLTYPLSTTKNKWVFSIDEYILKHNLTDSKKEENELEKRVKIKANDVAQKLFTTKS